MSKATKRAIGAIAFLLVLLTLLALCDRVFIRKTLAPPWDTTRKISGFYNEPEDEFSVMFFGGSHSYASFSPLELWRVTGVKSYVLATQQQPMWATYYYIREALKTQSPAVIVIDVNAMQQETPYVSYDVAHSYLDDLPLSWNKLRLIAESDGGSDTIEYLLPLVRYHDRWDELKKTDFTLDRSSLRDPRKGYVLLPDTGFVPASAEEADGSAGILDKSWDYLMRIRDLCEENDAALWLVKTPSNPDARESSSFRALAERLAQEGMTLDDFSFRGGELGLDLAADYYDQHHLNAAGAIKFTDAFAALLTERYPSLPKDPDNAGWQADHAQYKTDAAAATG